MTRPDIEHLRQGYRVACVHELIVRARGFELHPHRRLWPRIDARILNVGAARTRYHRREVRCQSLDALHAWSDPQRLCATCTARARCTAQLRLDLIAERRPWRLLLQRASAKRFLDYHALLLQRAVALGDIVHQISVINRGAWGELRFGDPAH